MKLKLSVFLALGLLSTSAFALEQSRNDFSTFTTRYLSQSMCQEDNYFRQCYLVTEEICLEAAKQAVHDCIDIQADKMGKVIKADDVQYWQQITGRCAGGIYDKKMHGYFKDEASCHEQEVKPQEGEQ